MKRFQSTRMPLAIAAGLLCLTSMVAAQAPIACINMFVDACNGSDAPPTTGLTINAPFKSLTAALNSAAGLSGTGNPPFAFVMHLAPGTYDTSNGEVFPIAVPDFVSIQGANVLNTVIAGNGGGSLLNYRSSLADAFQQEFVRNVTFTRASTGVLIDNDADGSAVHLNIVDCQFINCSVEGVRIEGSSSSQGTFTAKVPGGSINNVVVHRPRIVNNTFSGNGAGIRNTTSGLFSVGVGEPAIINCMMTNSLDFDGVDSLDVDSCGFDITRAGSGAIILTGSFVFPGVAQQALDTGINFPLYVEAATTQIGIDFRLQPNSSGINVGNGMSPNALPNGTTWSRNVTCGPAVGGMAIDLWDFDGEGHGNPRIVTTIDVGADEQDEYIVAGYHPETTEFRAATSSTARIWFAPIATPTTVLSEWINISGPFGTTTALPCAPIYQAGLVRDFPQGTFATAQTIAGFGPFWMFIASQPGTLFAQLPSVSPIPTTSFLRPLSINSAGPLFTVNSQATSINTATGVPAVAVSNLQSYSMRF